MRIKQTNVQKFSDICKQLFLLQITCLLSLYIFANLIYYTLVIMYTQTTLTSVFHGAVFCHTEEAKVEWFYEDLQDLLELTPKKRWPFHYTGLECKSRKSRNN